MKNAVMIKNQEVALKAKQEESQVVKKVKMKKWLLLSEKREKAHLCDWQGGGVNRPNRFKNLLFQAANRKSGGG